MSKNKTFTGPLAEHIRNFLNEKRTLGYKYEEQERVLSVLDRMSQQFDCSNGLPKALCLAFIQWDPNWKQRTQEQRVILIRTFAEYLIRHEIPAYLVDFSIVTKRNEDLMPQIPYIRIHPTHTFFILQSCVYSTDAAFVFQKLWDYE